MRALRGSAAPPAVVLETLLMARMTPAVPMAQVMMRGPAPGVTAPAWVARRPAVLAAARRRRLARVPRLVVASAKGTGRQASAAGDALSARRCRWAWKRATRLVRFPSGEPAPPTARQRR